jgi:hypothetical protein
MLHFVMSSRQFGTSILSVPPTQIPRETGHTSYGLSLRFSGLQVHAAQEVGEAGVRAKRIEDWVHFNHSG